jgi:N-acetylmuramoyl-L-alanine amidase
MTLALAEAARVVRSEALPASGPTPPRIFVDLQSGAPDLLAAAIANALATAGEEEVEGPPSARSVQLASTEAMAIPDRTKAKTENDGTEPRLADRDYPIPPLKPPALDEEDAPRPGTQVAMLVPPDVLPARKPKAATGNRIPVIVLDAGHGGRDPGAIGVRGTMEKDVTLTMAKELQTLLESTGRYKVVLTRRDDRLLALRQRIDAARAARADLFISLHADHIEKTALRGASVYTLSEHASDAEAAALAARENKEDLISGIDLSSQSAMVTSILIDLAQRETKNLSARFASMLTEELASRTLVLRNSHRFAGFVVLKAPDVPSVLVELGYLSNREDEAALNSKRHRRLLARAVREAVDRYFEWHASLR